jgi:hypothetical protein
VKSGGCDPRIIIYWEAFVRRTFKKYCTHASRSPARLVRHFFSMLDTPKVLLRPRAGHIFDEVLGGEEGTGGSELATGVGTGGGQPGSSAMVGRSLAIDQPCESRVSLGGEERRSEGQRRVGAGGATRSGGGGPQDRPPLEKPGTEGFRINTSVPNIFCKAAT